MRVACISASQEEWANARSVLDWPGGSRMGWGAPEEASSGRKRIQ